MDNHSNEISFSDIMKGLSIAAVLIVLLAAGYIAGIVVAPNGGFFDKEESTQSFTVQNPENIKQVKINTDYVTVPSSESTTQTEATSEVETTKPLEENKDKDVTDKKPNKTDKKDDKENKEKTTEEIVELFNTSANKIKGEATKVVKNYEHRTVNEDKLVVPSSLQGLAEDMIKRFMTDDTEPIEYTTKEDIAENYMVPSQSYVSKLTVDDVQEASCKDNGSEYEITIKAKEQKNPTAGVGLAAAFDVVEANEVSEKTSLIEKFDTIYHDCVVKCKIDKETGRMTWANYTTPLVLDCTVRVFTSVNASVGLTFEKDYNIYY